MSAYQNPSESFHLWEKEILHQASTTPDIAIENIIINSTDVVHAAKNLAEYAKNDESNLQHNLIAECIHKLNYYYMGRHITDTTTVTINGKFGNPQHNVSNDMADLLLELQNSQSAKVAGRLGFFEKHLFEDNETGAQVPTICLRMYDAAFLKNKYDSAGQVDSCYTMSIPNYVTIPVENIEDYEILGKEF